MVCLIVCVTVFFYIARFHQSTLQSDSKQTTSSPNKISPEKMRTLILSIYNMDADHKYTIMKEINQPPADEQRAFGLYQFSDIINSALYTYSMLLLVSLPKLPTGWSLRILTGWYWLYCLLVVTSYRASMTAILARPTPK